MANRTRSEPLRRERGVPAARGVTGATRDVRSAGPAASSTRSTTPGRRLSRPRVAPEPPKRLLDYPRSGRHGVARFLPSAKQVIGCLLLVAFVCVGGFVAAYLLIPIPGENTVAVSQTSIISYDNGKPIGQLGAQNRVRVPLNRVPKHVQHAVLAAEDRDFYSEPGFSVTGFLRAAWAYVRGESLQGGSTITQQYVKKTYLTDNRTFSRKFKELILSIKMEQRLSKDQILQHYLNTVYFGRGAYGVQTASKAYFGKDVSKLTSAQGAVLASLIRSPALYDPVRHRENLVPRFHYVVNGMESKGWLTGDQVASMRVPKVTRQETENQYRGQRGYLLQMVKDELERKGISEDELLTGGYRVQTTFNKRYMRYAKQAVRTAYPDVFRQEKVDIGIAAVEPGTGRIMAIYGGRGYLKHQLNNATRGGLTQPGSSFKPYVLATALQNGIGLRTVYNGRSPQKVAGHKFRNSGGEQFGYINLPTALEHSVNTVFVQLGQEVGIRKVVDNAKQVGIQTSPWCPLAKGNTKMDDAASTPLGPMDVCPLEQAGGYATFMNQGKYVEPTTIEKVTNASGNKVIYQADPAPRKVFTKGVSADTLYAMQKVVRGGTGTAARLPDGRPVAGKTGTSSDNRSAWWVGGVPQLTAAVAMYKGQGGQIPPVAGYNEVFGGTIPARVWEVFMAKATQHMKVEEFPPPAWVGEPKHQYPTEPVVTDTPTPTPTEPTQPQPSTTEPTTPSETTTESPTPQETNPSATPTGPNPFPTPPRDTNSSRHRGG